MGLFKKAPAVCSICKSDIVGKPQYAKDGMICNRCYVAAGFPASISVTDVPVSVLREQIYSVDGLSISKRTQEKMAGRSTAPAPASGTEACIACNVPKCPKCGSTSISADKKGFGIGKAVVGAAVAGPVGLVAGNINAKKVRITCLNCGHQWKAGKA